MIRGRYFEFKGRPAVRFRCAYQCSKQTLWKAVSEPDELAHWFPSRVRIDPYAGGDIEFFPDQHADPETGIVLVYSAPRTLAFTWSGDEIHFEVEPTAEGCALTLVNVLEVRNTAARIAAGWSVCLTDLNRFLDGSDVSGHRGEMSSEWRPLYQTYLGEGMPSGAMIPGDST
ncbi:SRPBCC family protein [Rhodococcus marinonascens]|uniref:SRPBCC family protein n=1 Tax=Rhodococcus marinonascens TaxID=38311 RepID=UPI000933559A|nr:SRPBCC family protein [Rhodococcus marinonascens]